MQLHPTLKVVPHTSNEGLYSIKLRATFQTGSAKWVQKYYPLKLYCTLETFERITSATGRTEDKKIIRLSEEEKQMRVAIIEAEAKANEILRAHEIVTIDVFEQKYTNKANFKSVKSMIEAKIKTFDNKTKKTSTPGHYLTLMNRIEDFAPGVTFLEINKNWLDKFIKKVHSKDNRLNGKHGRYKKLTKKENSKTTSAIYLRCLRHICINAIDEGYMKQEFYPFGKKGHKIKKTKKRHIALSMEEKDEMLALCTGSDNPYIRFAADYWALSFHLQGLNLTDIAKLQFKDLVDNKIVKERGKIEDSESMAPMIVMNVKKEVRDIIRRQGIKSLNPNDYIFPILPQGCDEGDIRDLVKNFSRRINNGLRRIQAQTTWGKELTTYTARHTFAAWAVEHNWSLEQLQQAFGHANPTTTKNYIDEFVRAMKIAG